MHIYIFAALKSLLPEVADHGTASIHVAMAVMHFKKYDALKVLFLKFAGPVRGSRAK